MTIVQEATASFADDVATTKRAIAEQNGPVILVGHSYGGAVITENTGNDPKELLDWCISPPLRPTKVSPYPR